MKKIVVSSSFYNGVNTNVGKLENVLNNYWEKKKSYLDVDAIVRDHFEWSTQDGYCQVEGRGPQKYTDSGMQFP